MRQYQIIVRERANRQILAVAARGAPHLADDLAAAFRRLEACPEMAPPALLGGRWSPMVHKLILGESGYHLYYRVNHTAGLVLVLAIRHARQRPLRRL
jgi:plasmid stabilization system protein ParE